MYFELRNKAEIILEVNNRISPDCYYQQVDYCNAVLALYKY
jgi:hypothetical protein